MAHGTVHVVLDGLAAGDHVAVLELHGLGALCAQLARHDHLAALGAALHDEAQHAVAGATNGEASEELVAQGLCLCDCAEAAVGHLLRVQLHAALRKLEALLHHAGELADAAALLAWG